MKLKHRFLTATLSATMLTSAISAANADTLFWSTQARPAEEAQSMRTEVLAGAGQTVDYQPSEDGPWLTRLQAELSPAAEA